MFKLAHRLSAATACFVFLFVNTPAATLAQEAPPPTEPVQSASPPVTDHTITEGTHVLDAAAVSSLSSLTIGRGATAVIDFGNASHFTLPGDLVNKGNLFVGSSNSAVTAAHLNAANIVNRGGALISSVLPTEGVGGFTSVVANLDLVLSAVQNILNQGTIRSSGNLTMNAGGSIVNEAVMSAAQNVNLMSAIGNITNTGTISALAGNLNITAATASNIALNNVGGTLEALNASINVASALANIDVSGGRLLSDAVNLTSATGAVAAHVDELTGSLNVEGTYAHVGASTDNLTLGEVKVDGDPTVYNSGGDITLSGTISVAENLAILASRNILASSPVTITTQDASGQGHDVYLVAGASLTAGGSSTSSIPPLPGGEVVSVNGPSATGGSISLSGGSKNIDTSSTCTDCDGGSVRMVAFRGGPTGTGFVQVIGLGNSITTSGTGAATSGDVEIIAGRSSGLTVNLQFVSVNATGGSGGGTVRISAAQPAFLTGAPLTFNSDGTVAGGNAFVADFSNPGGDINFGQGCNVTAENVAIRSGAGSIVGFATVLTGTSSVDVRAFSHIVFPSSLPFGPHDPFRFHFNSPGGLVTLLSDTGGIGAPFGDVVVVTAGDLIANAPNGSVRVAGIDGALNLGPTASGALGTFEVGNFDGNLTTSGTITAASVLLGAGSGSVFDPANTNVLIGADVIATGNVLLGTSGLSVALFANGGGSIRTVNSARVYQTNSTGGVGLFSNLGGSIGTGDTDRLSLEARRLIQVATDNGGNIYLDELSDVQLVNNTIFSITSPFLGIQGSGGTADLKAGGNISVQSNPFQQNSFQADNVSITSTGGSITFTCPSCPSGFGSVFGTTSVNVQASGNISTADTVTLMSPTGTVTLTSLGGNITIGSGGITAGQDIEMKAPKFVQINGIVDSGEDIRVITTDFDGSIFVGAAGALTADDNVYLEAPFNLSNLGTIESRASNINVISTSVVNSGNGFIKALNGTVNVSNSLFFTTLIINNRSTTASIVGDNIIFESPQADMLVFNSGTIQANQNIDITAGYTGSAFINLSVLNGDSGAGPPGLITAPNVNITTTVSSGGFGGVILWTPISADTLSAHGTQLVVNDGNLLTPHADLLATQLLQLTAFDVLLVDPPLNPGTGDVYIQAGLSATTNSITTTGTGVTGHITLIANTALSFGALDGWLISATCNNCGFSVNESITAIAQITLTASGLLNINAPVAIPGGSTGTGIFLSAHDIDYTTGTVDTGQGIVLLNSLTTNPISVGGSAPFDISLAELDNTTAGTVLIQGSGSMTVDSAVNVSGISGQAGVFRFRLFAFDTITVNAPLTAQTFVGLDAFGAGGITLNAAVTSTGTMSISALGGGADVRVNSSVSAPSDLEIVARGSIMGPGSLESADMHLFVVDGNIDNGSGGRLNINAGTLEAMDVLTSTPGNVLLHETDDVLLLPEDRNQAGGAWDLLANGDIILEHSGEFETNIMIAGSVNLESINGSIDARCTGCASEGVVGNIRGTNGVTLTAYGDVTIGADNALISSAGSVNVTSQTGAITVDRAITSGGVLGHFIRLRANEIDYTSGTLNAGGGAVFLQTSSAVPISVGGAQTFDISTTELANTTAAAVAISGDGDITVDSDIDVSSTSGTPGVDPGVFALDLSSGSGNITLNNSVKAQDFLVLFADNGNVLATTGHGELSAGTGGTITLIGDGGMVDVSVDSITGTVFGQASTTFALQAALSDLTVAFVEATDSVALTTSRLVVNGTITANGPTGTVLVQNPAGTSALTVEGAGTVTAPTSITFTATDAVNNFPSLTVGSAGDTLTLNGPVFMEACDGVASVTQGATISQGVVDTDISVEACLFINFNEGVSVLFPPGAGMLNLQVCPTCTTGNGGKKGGTIANPGGNVVLSNKMVVDVDGDLAIIARNNVTAPGNVNNIKLGAGGGDAGNLTIIAGFEISVVTPGTPTPSGQVFDKTNAFAIGAPSAGGGNVMLGGVNVNTSASGPGSDGGNVLVVAHGGTVNAGNIAIGNINTSSQAGAAGNVTIRAHCSVQTGTINTLGATANGFVDVSAGAEPVPTGAVVILNGTIITGQTFVPAMPPPFSLFIMPTSVVAPINWTCPAPTSSSSGGGGGGPSASADTEDESELVPVSFIQSAAPLTAIKNGIHTVSHNTAIIKHDGSADLQVEQPGVLLLNAGGEVLVIASRDTVVKAGIAHVSVSKGTIAVLGMDGDSVTVRNLRESRGNSLTVYVNGKHSLRVAAGEEVVVGTSYSAYRGALQDQLVGRRKLEHQELSCGVNVASCEFSLPTLMRNSYVLQKLARSEDKADRDVTNTLTKMAACLHLVTARHGAYSHRVP